MAVQAGAAAIPVAAALKADRRNRVLFRVWGSIRKSPKGVIGLSIVSLLFLLAIFGQYVAPYDPNVQDDDSILAAPNAAHWLGTDNLGRDALSRLFYGAQISLQVGVFTVALAAIIGVVAGLVCAFFRGVADQIIMRIADGIMAFPSLMLALALVAVLGPSLQSIIIAIAFGNIPKFTRVVRGQALTVVSTDYVTAARTIGASQLRIMAQHVWPNSTDSIIVQTSLAIGTAIIAEASLSFLGLGVPPPTPTWGWMLKTGYPFIQTAAWVPIVPGLAIFLTVLGFNLLGDVLRDALDPHVTD